MAETDNQRTLRGDLGKVGSWFSSSLTSAKNYVGDVYGDVMDYTFGDPNYPQNVGTPITSPVLPDVSSFKSDQSTGNFLTDLTNLLSGQDVMKKFKPAAPTTSDYLSAAALGVGGIGSLLFPGFFSSQREPAGYRGSIPLYDAVRTQVPNTFDPNRRPGSGGQRYFSDVQFVPKGEGLASLERAATEAKGLEAINKANPASFPLQTMREGGIATAAKKQGMYLDGATDGMADEIPAMIDGEQPAMLSDGEFVIPADVVSHLGNGNSDAGAKELENMMDEIRMARTGTKKQAPEIDPQDFLPT